VVLVLERKVHGHGIIGVPFAPGFRQITSGVTELWTFMRARGGNWLFSAIQQT
jgi:hypothetical protein